MTDLMVNPFSSFTKLKAFLAELPDKKARKEFIKTRHAALYLSFKKNLAIFGQFCKRIGRAKRGHGVIFLDRVSKEEIRLTPDNLKNLEKDLVFAVRELEIFTEAKFRHIRGARPDNLVAIRPEFIPFFMNADFGLATDYVRASPLSQGITSSRLLTSLLYYYVRVHAQEMVLAQAGIQVVRDEATPKNLLQADTQMNKAAEAGGLAPALEHLNLIGQGRVANAKGVPVKGSFDIKIGPAKGPKTVYNVNVNSQCFRYIDLSRIISYITEKKVDDVNPADVRIAQLGLNKEAVFAEVAQAKEAIKEIAKVAREQAAAQVAAAKRVQA